MLIERVRSAVTDSAGRYTIIDSRPGTYDCDFPPPKGSTRSGGKASS